MKKLLLAALSISMAASCSLHGVTVYGPLQDRSKPELIASNNPATQYGSLSGRSSYGTSWRYGRGRARWHKPYGSQWRQSRRRNGWKMTTKKINRPTAGTAHTAY